MCVHACVRVVYTCTYYVHMKGNAVAVALFSKRQRRYKTCCPNDSMTLKDFSVLCLSGSNSITVIFSTVVRVSAGFSYSDLTCR